VGRSIELDTSKFPLVVVTFDGVQTAEEIEAYLTAFDKVHARRELFALIVHMKKYSTETKLRDRMGKWMRDCEPITRKYCVCTAMVTASTGFRFVLSALFLVKPLVVPYKVCADVDEALLFVRSEAAKRQLSLPA
jgi:hypothetical protein